MIFFGKKHCLLETPFFSGFKDRHSHILPSVDDGVKELDESLSVLSYFEGLGVSHVTLTPHVMVGVNSSGEDIESSYATLCAAYEGTIMLSLASEYMLDSNFLNHLKLGVRLLDPTHILVETSYLSAPENFEELLYSVVCEGLTPVVAHPERYRYMSRSKYHALKERDYGLQLNLLSFTDIYGADVCKSAIYLLEQGMYDMVGSDLHNLRTFKSRIKSVKLSSKHIDLLLKVKGAM